MAKIGTDIEYAAALLRQGKLVGIPTETVYGLAGNAFDLHAIARIFEVKQRPQNVPFIAQTDSMEKVQGWTKDFPLEATMLAKKYWPGALTLILEKADLIPDSMTNGGNTVGVRIPNHPMTLELLSLLDFPLAVPSANVHGQKSPVTAQEVNDMIGGEIDYILDGGTCEVGFESTIIGFDGNDPVLYRQGALNIGELESVINKKIKRNKP